MAAQINGVSGASLEAVQGLSVKQAAVGRFQAAVGQLAQLMALAAEAPCSEDAAAAERATVDALVQVRDSEAIRAREETRLGLEEQAKLEGEIKTRQAPLEHLSRAFERLRARFETELKQAQRPPLPQPPTELAPRPDGRGSGLWAVHEAWARYKRLQAQELQLEDAAVTLEGEGGVRLEEKSVAAMEAAAAATEQSGAEVEAAATAAEQECALYTTLYTCVLTK